MLGWRSSVEARGPAEIQIGIAGHMGAVTDARVLPTTTGTKLDVLNADPPDSPTPKG